MSQPLTEQSCEPCEGWVDPMDEATAQEFLSKVSGWNYVTGDAPKIRKSFEFDDFVTAIEFVNDVAEVAEREAHHPNLEIDYNVVTVTVWTHAIDGLSENDFILAAKINDVS